MNDIDISVIMPAYNTEMYIGEAIDSVCRESKPKVELIVINDGSTDSTEKVILEKMKQYNNIVYIKEENSGLSYAREVGIKKSRGKYIYFVDSDDMINEGSLKFMFDMCENNELDCLMVNSVFKNELDNDFGRKMDKKNVVSKISSTGITDGETLLYEMIKNREWRYAVWLYFMKKTTLEKVTFFKDYIHEDSAFNYQLLSNIKRIEFIDYDAYIYRLRKNSLMSTKTSIKNILGYINSYLIICKTNNEKEFSYKNLLFEIRILDQIIESYNRLDEIEKEKAKLEFEKIIPQIISRNNYYVDKYRDFFEVNKVSFQNDYLIDYLEVDVVDHCNLNCNNCSHFSPLTNEGFMNIETFESDIQRVSKLTNGKLKRLVLMGGEPLLHKDIVSLLKVARKYFKNTQIQLLTNGILINKMDDKFWNACKELNIQINVTPYPININYYDIYDKILSHGIKLFIYDNGSTDDKVFNRYVFDETKSQDAKDSFDNCGMSRVCANLKNGKIYLCPITNNIVRYNNYYGTNLEVTKDDYIDIYETDSVEDICNFLKKPTPFCKYCNIKAFEKVKWERFKK